MSVNKVILVGNLGRDPEMRYTPDGTPVCNVSLATEESWNNKTSGAKEKRTTWHRLVFWRALAETVAKYLTKGSRVYVEGKIQVREYDDKETGAKRQAFEIVVNEMKMLGSAGGNGESNGESEQPPAGQQRQTQQAQPQTQQAQPQHTEQSHAEVPAGGSLPPGVSEDDDDLPF